MELQSARIEAFLRRKAVQLLGFNEISSVGIERGNRKALSNFEKICQYSNGFTTEIFDPRISSTRGHYYQERSAYLVKDVILEPRQGLIYSAVGEIINESTSWQTAHVYNSFPWNPKKGVKELPLESAIYITSNTFYHWLIEDLASTIFCLGLNPSSPILVAKNCPPFVLDFLNTTNREVIFLSGPVKVKSLLMVAKGKDSGWPHPRDIQELLSYQPFALCLKKQIPGRRIYVSRKNARRSPDNEAEVEKTFQNLGFEVLELEKLTLLDQIASLSQASLIAGVHGAGLTNAIWLKEGSKVLDIVNENYWTECFHRLCVLKEVQYSFHVCEGKIQDPIALPGLIKQVNEIY
jgi:hypothetical protein